MLKAPSPRNCLCEKRFNVKPPGHVRPDNEPETTNAAREEATAPLMITSGSGERPAPESSGTPHGNTENRDTSAKKKEREEVNAERNDAVEAKTASEDLLKAVFGDSDDDD